MKTQKNMRIALTLAIAAFGSLVTGCGSSNGTNVGQNGGRLGTGGLPGGCIPMAQQIGFNGTGVRFDWANIVGGAVPNSAPVGQITVTAGAAGGPYSRSGVDGTISLNAQQLGQAGNPQTGYPQTGYPQTGYPQQQSSTANIQGFVQISPQTQSDIIFQVQSGRIPIGNMGGGTTVPQLPQPGMPGYNPYQPQQPYNPYQPQQQTQVCVSGIAINVGHYYNTIYGGNVYLYLNGTQRGYVLYF